MQGEELIQITELHLTIISTPVTEWRRSDGKACSNSRMETLFKAHSTTFIVSLGLFPILFPDPLIFFFPLFLSSPDPPTTSVQGWITLIFFLKSSARIDYLMILRSLTTTHMKQWARCWQHNGEFTWITSHTNQLHLFPPPKNLSFRVNATIPSP